MLMSSSSATITITYDGKSIVFFINSTQNMWEQSVKKKKILKIYWNSHNYERLENRKEEMEF